jgi:hypothetical protein
MIGSTSVGEAIGATLTAGTGITITNASGSITIAGTGNGNFVNQMTSSATFAPGNIYMANDSSSLITFTFPATAAVGDSYEIIGSSADGWKALLANTGQYIYFGTSTSTESTGYLASTNQYDCIKFRCNVANTSWVAYGAQGNITVV